MKLYIKWAYPDEIKEHEHTYYDIDPSTIRIHYGMVCFGEKDVPDRHWIYPINHVIEMKVENE